MTVSLAPTHPLHHPIHSWLLNVKVKDPRTPIHLEKKLTKCKQVIDSVNLITYKQERRDAGGFDTSQELICELYDFTDGEYTETKFKLSDAKNLPSFNGTEDNTAAYYESFMHAVSNPGKASKLNSKG